MFSPFKDEIGFLHIVIFVVAVFDDLVAGARQALESADEENEATLGLAVSCRPVVLERHAQHIVPRHLLSREVVVEESILIIMLYYTDRLLGAVEGDFELTEHFDVR